MARMGSILASWWCTTGLLLAAAAPYLTFTFGEAPFSRWKEFMFHAPAGAALCLGLAVNLIAASIRVMLRYRQGTNVAAEDVRSMDAWTEFPVSGSAVLADAEAWMRSKGFSVIRGESSLRGTRGKMSFIPGLVTRTGFAILILSLLVSVNTRQTKKELLRTGEQGDFFGTIVTVTGLEADLPSDFLQVGEESSFLVEHAVVSVSQGGVSSRITPGLPAQINGDYYRLVHIGYAQPLSAASGKGIHQQVLMLDILPPGKADMKAIPGTGRFFSISLEPVRTISKGLLKGRQYDLKSPLYRVSIQNTEDRKRSAPATARPGGNASVGGTELSLQSYSLYAGIQAVRDPALIWIYLGSIIAIVGTMLMTLRFFWYRKEMKAVLTGMTLLIGYNEEFFKKWGMQYFDQWKKEPAGLGNRLKE